MNKVIVQLKIYKGNDIAVSRKTDKVLNQHQKIMLAYDTKEWHNFIGTMYKNGFGVAEVVSAQTQIRNKGEATKYEDVSADTFKKIDAEVQSKLKVDEDKNLTKDQKEIKALKDTVAKLVASGSSNRSPVADNTPDINEELEAARDRYFIAFGKRPNNLMKLSNLNEKSEEKEKENAE